MFTIDWDVGLVGQVLWDDSCGIIVALRFRKKSDLHARTHRKLWQVFNFPVVPTNLLSPTLS